MSRVCFIIGPSGVGKSTHGRQYGEKRRCTVIDSDSSLKMREGSASAYLRNNGRETFFLRTKECVQEDIAKVNTDGVLVIVGAGQLEYANEKYNDVESWLRSGKTLAIVDAPEHIISRLGSRPRAGFEEREFTEVRLSLYRAADKVVDVKGRTVAQSHLEVQSALDDLFEWDPIPLTAEDWFGYGDWATPYWFIGPEPGMKKAEGENLRAW